MELPPGLGTIWQQLESFEQFMSDFHATIKDPARKEMFGDLLHKLQKANAEAKEIVPGVVQNLKSGTEQSKAEVEALAKEFERMQAELERMKAEAAKGPKPAAPPVRPPEPAVEAKLGKQYGQELLEAFGPPPEPASAPTQEGSLWRQVDQVPNEPEPHASFPTKVNPRSAPQAPNQPREGSLWRELDDPDKPS